MERIPVEAWKIRGCMSHVVMVHKSWENHKSKTSNIASSLSLPAEPHLSTQGCGNMVKAKEIGSFSPWNRGISSNSSQAQICSVHRRGHSWGEETGMNCSSGCQTKFTIPTAWAPAPSLPHGVAAPAPHTVPSLLERAQRGSGRGLGLSQWCCVRAQNGLTLPKSWRRRDHVALQSHQGWNTERWGWNFSLQPSCCSTALCRLWQMERLLSWVVLGGGCASLEKHGSVWAWEAAVRCYLPKHTEHEQITAPTSAPLLQDGSACPAYRRKQHISIRPGPQHLSVCVTAPGAASFRWPLFNLCSKSKEGGKHDLK